MIFKRVAVIGSNGFLGRHLTERLLSKPGITVDLFGKNEESIFGSELYRKLDVSNENQVKEYFVNTDLIYYLASQTIPASSWEEPIMEIEQNLIPFLKFMKSISSLNVKKVVFTSSGGTVYGGTAQKVPENASKNPFSPHGIIKLTMEYFLNYFQLKNNIAFDIYRISNVYGIGQNTQKGLGIINTFIEKIIAEKKIQIFGNGNNIRNYLYVNDLAELLTLSLIADPNKSEVYNASSNDTMSINDLVKLFKEIIDEHFDVVYTETRGSDNPGIQLDNTKILNAYPDFEFTNIEEGILKTYQFIKNHS